MATIDRIAELLRQQEKLDRAREPSGVVRDTDEPKSNRQGRVLTGFSNVMRDAFEASLRMRRRASDFN
jgi:hypothetical protein